MNYYERHIGDYIRSTVSLTMAQDGAYTRLLDQIYGSESPLPSDRKHLHRLAGAETATERKAVDYVLDTFFVCTDAGYTQNRAMREIAHFHERAVRGKRNADSRWNKHRAQQLGNANAQATRDANDDATLHANAMQTACKTDAHQTPVSNTQTPVTPTTPNPSADTAGNRASAEAEADGGGGPALAIAKILQGAAVSMHPADPRIRKLADDGVEPASIAVACAEARRSRPNEEIRLAYVLAVLKRLSDEAKNMAGSMANAPSGKAPAKLADVWWTSNAGIERKGRELGLYARGTESHADFKDRIFAEIDKRKVQP